MAMAMTMTTARVRRTQQSGEKGTWKGKGTTDGKGKGMVTEDGKGKEMGKGKRNGNGKGKGIVKQTPGKMISLVPLLAVADGKNEADPDTEG